MFSNKTLKAGSLKTDIREVTKRIRMARRKLKTSDKAMNDEVKRYYVSAPDKEINSDISAKTFDIWSIVESWRKKLGIGNRLLDVGVGTGHLAHEALKKGYNVMGVDLLEEIVQKVTIKFPELKGKLQIVNVVDEKSVSEFVRKFNQFDIVTILGLVPNHAENKQQLMTTLYNLKKFAGVNSLIVEDLLLEEMFPGRPENYWSEFTHTLTSIAEVGEFFRKYGLRLLDAYTIHEIYPVEREFDQELDEHYIRLFIHKPPRK
jgi:2-polyprenyl-3-methyl-5-hydroxy-6-metoxy-1,4-benzoquinol methylase